MQSCKMNAVKVPKGYEGYELMKKDHVPAVIFLGQEWCE